MDCHHSFQSILLVGFSLQVVWGLEKVILLNPPDEPVSGYNLKILYSCSRHASVHVEIQVFFDTGKSSTILLSQWGCKPGSPRVRILPLIFPDWLVFQADALVPHSEWVLSVMLHVAVKEDAMRSSRHSVLARDMATLQPRPPLSRPLKQHQLCLSWGARMLWLSQLTSMTQCLVEQETAHFLSSMYASTGERFGITRVLHPFKSEILEYLRFKAVSFPWCTFSIWVFLTRHCQQRMCGLLHHIDSHNNYVTPTLFLTTSGHVHVQMNGESGVSTAILSPYTVPLHQWCHINIDLRGNAVSIALVCVNGQQHTVQDFEHTLRHTVELDDTEGYFVIGGGRFVRGFEGYYGPVVYYRTRIPPFSTYDTMVPDHIKQVNLSGWLQSCNHFQIDLYVKMSGYLLKARQKQEFGSCTDGFCKWTEEKTLPVDQCEPWEAPTVRHRQHAVHVAKSLAFKRGGREVELASVGRTLYLLSHRKLSRASDKEEVRKIVPLLLQSGCLGDNRALHLASVLYSSGLGVKRQPNKAFLLALLAAQSDWRLALLRLGHLHHVGEMGSTPDSPLAYAYYSNIAKQTSSDHLNPSPQQVFVESVYLNNDEVLSLQTNKDHDIFHWLKHQARNGAAEAEQAVARMLFWGQQGVSPDIQTAVRHYERGAVRLGDPMSMYDFAIVLLQGQGVKKDIPRALTFLKKAIALGFAPAMNALGWYYERFEKDYQRAVQLWEQADLHGSPDAAMNLGVMYSQGLYPGKPADQAMAYKYYLKSAERGHINGAIQLADIWTTGIPGHVKRQPLGAVLWAKWAAENNGHLGLVLRTALNFYFEGNMLMALLYYLMAAESGYAAAQFNVAYLCEQNSGRFLDSSFAKQCMMRYYNLTVQSKNPDSYALIRMGDLLYGGHEGRKRDVAVAADMYKQAALREDPQGWYNLGVLVQEGHRLPLSVLTELGLEDSTVLLPSLYTRCRDANKTDSYLPCSLALFNVYLQSLQKDYSETIKFSGAVAVAVAAPPILLIILGILRGRGRSNQ
ncbi:protein sel-1 homolog 3 [Aplochiton taeniatus]